MNKSHSALFKRFSELSAAILCGMALSFVSCGGSGSKDKDGGIGSDGDVTDGGATDNLVSPDGQSSGDAGQDGGTENPQWRDLFMDQNFVVPTNAEVGDVVGLVRLYPTLLDQEPMFSVVDDSPAPFAMDEVIGLITVAHPEDLDPSGHQLTVRVEINGYWDEALMTVQVLAPEQVVFIDPDNDGDPSKDGTRAHPFASWAEISWEAGLAYLQRRGTTSVETEQVAIGQNDILLGSYGVGDLPIIDSSATHGVSAWRKSGITVRDLEVRSSATSSINWSSPTDLLVTGCVLHGGIWGMRFTGDPPPSGIQIFFTEIFDTGDDGMFVQNTEQIEIGGVYIHNVNTRWSPPETPESEAAGDSIQLHRVHHFHVHHSVLDRESSGNKFCFIANECSDGIFEHNILSGPLETPQGGASVYIGGTPLTHSTVIRYNTFKGPTPGAIYSHATDLQILGNIFVNLPRAIWTNGAAEVHNNVFSDIPTSITGGGEVVARNNVFHLVQSEHEPFGSLDLTQDHNLFSQDPDIEGALVGDPRFVDSASGDFRLLPDSPAIDQGVDVGITTDRLGTPIPQGSGPDIGAFEHR